MYTIIPNNGILALQSKPTFFIEIMNMHKFFVNIFVGEGRHFLSLKIDPKSVDLTYSLHLYDYILTSYEIILPKSSDYFTDRKADYQLISKNGF